MAKLRLALAALLGISASSAVMAQNGSFFAPPVPSKEGPAKEGATSPQPSPASPSQGGEVAPQPKKSEVAPPLAPGPTLPPAQSVISPVTRLHSLPLADWRNLSTFVAQQYGVSRISREFLTAFVALDNCAVWRRDQADEFKMEDYRKAAKGRLAGQPAATRVRVPLRLRLEAYDFDKEGFPLPPFNAGTTLSMPARESCPGLPGPSSAVDIPYNYTLKLTEAAQWKPLLPVSSDRGHTVVMALPPDRSVYAELVVDLFDLPSSANDAIAIIGVHPVAVFVWLDEHQHQFIGVAGAASADAESAGTQAPVPPQPPTLPAPGPAAPPGGVDIPVGGSGTGRADASGGQQAVSPPQPPPSPMPRPGPAQDQGVASTASAITGKGQLMPIGLIVGGHPIRLSGIDRLPPPTSPIGGRLAGWISSQQVLTCDPRAGDTYRCLTADNKDVAQAALINGAARAAPDAPETYQDLELAAKKAKRGIWQ